MTIDSLVIAGLWTLMLASIAHTIYWFVVGVHIVRTLSRLPTARSALAQIKPVSESDSMSSTRRVCVIVPAHNEQARIATIAKTLLGQDYPSLSLVFVLDRCTDGTQETLERTIAEYSARQCAADASAKIPLPTTRILEISRCPDDWAGKTHAIWRGVQDAPEARSADVLIFIDADTQIEARCVEACMRLMEDRKLDLLSLLSTLTSDQWFELIAQPPAAFELMRQYPMLRANSNRPGRHRAFANGQFIMVRREAYHAFGGHEAVKWAVLEDVELARQAHRHHCRTGVFLADGMLGCCMYDTFKEFRLGWNRIYRESANSRPRRLRVFAWRLLLVGVVLPMMTLLGAVVGFAAWWGLALISSLGFVLWLMLLMACYRAGRTPMRFALMYPVGAWIVSRILFGAARDLKAGTPIRWGGKTYIRPAR